MLRNQPGSEKLVLVMVGLPARGKTSVARKLQRYLSWLGYRTFCVNVGDYRRVRAGAKQPAEFFAPDNRETREKREGFAVAALDDLLAWFARGGEIGIYDATNTERSRRDMIYDRCVAAGTRPVLIESICTDPDVVERNIRRNKLLSPDYEGMPPEEAVADFRRRIAFYERTYEPVAENDRSYIKLIDAGRQIVANRMESFLCSRLVQYLMHIHPAERPIFLTRHGESSYNVLGRIGGDAPLTARGREYSRVLAQFIQERLDARSCIVLTSTLQRTLETATGLPFQPVSWRALDEIDAGVCDGMTYEEIKARMPEEFAARAADKFRYRYPRGESYADVILRLEPVIVEVERHRDSVVVIAHQAILRALYGYFVGKPQEECPYLSIPLHTVIELTPTEAGYQEKRVALLD